MDNIFALIARLPKITQIEVLDFAGQFRWRYGRLMGRIVHDDPRRSAISARYEALDGIEQTGDRYLNPEFVDKVFQEPYLLTTVTYSTPWSEHSQIPYKFVYTIIYCSRVYNKRHPNKCKYPRFGKMLYIIYNFPKYVSRSQYTKQKIKGLYHELQLFGGQHVTRSHLSNGLHVWWFDHLVKRITCTSHDTNYISQAQVEPQYRYKFVNYTQPVVLRGGLICA